MAQTKTDLANLALALVGGAGIDTGAFQITSIADTSSKTAILCNTHYEQARRETLVRAWWDEAAKYADLGAELSDIEKADWDYAFNLPSDYLGRCEQINESYHASTKPRYLIRYDHEIMSGKLLTNDLTNEAGTSAYIRYIWDLTDTAKLSPLLFKAIATNLAATIATPLTGDGGKRRLQLLEEYEQLILPLAQGANASQGSDDEDLGEFATIRCRTE